MLCCKALEREVEGLASYVEESGVPTFSEVRDFVEFYIDGLLQDTDTISEIAARIKDMGSE